MSLSRINTICDRAAKQFKFVITAQVKGRVCEFVPGLRNIPDCFASIKRYYIKYCLVWKCQGLYHYSCLWGDFIVAFQYVKGASKKDRNRLFNSVCSYRTKGNGFTLEPGRFRLDKRKKCFTMRVVKH